MGNGQLQCSKSNYLRLHSLIIWDAVLIAWEKIDTGAEFAGNYMKVIQGAGGAYVDFIGRLTDSIEK